MGEYKGETREKWSLKVCVCVNMFEFDNKDSEGQRGKLLVLASP